MSLKQKYVNLLFFLLLMSSCGGSDNTFSEKEAALTDLMKEKEIKQSFIYETIDKGEDTIVVYKGGGNGTATISKNDGKYSWYVGQNPFSVSSVNGDKHIEMEGPIHTREEKDKFKIVVGNITEVNNDNIVEDLPPNAKILEDENLYYYVSSNNDEEPIP